MHRKTKSGKLIAILIALALAMPYGCITAAADDNPFTDVKDSHWFYDAVLYAYDNGLMTGTAADKFSPNMKLTRGMIVTVLGRYDDAAEAASDSPFTDVDIGAYYAPYVYWAAENDIVIGYDGKFSPNANITRQDLATIMFRYAQYADVDVSVGEDTNILSYNDALSISEYAIPAIQWTCGAGVMSGKPGGYIDPKGGATRAEFAMMLMRYHEYTEDLGQKPETEDGNVRVGISWMEDTDVDEYSEDLQAYIDALEMAGAEVVLLPRVSTEAQAMRAVNSVDAIVMTGGEDIDPAEYGEEPDEMLEDVNKERDKSDRLILSAAIDRDMPVLGTCRGMQMLNIIQGGTLYQDIPTMYETDILHRSVDEVDFEYHDITVEKDSLVAQIMGKTRFKVNSWHHQGVKDLGDGLKIVAKADDGMIEAIELEGAAFVLGVGFHPEWHIAEGQPEFLAFFERLIKEAAK